MSEQDMQEPRAKSHGWVWVVLALGVAAGTAFWWWTTRQEQPQVAQPAPEAPPPPTEPPPPSMPSVQEADAMVRKAAADVSPSPKYAEWLRLEDLARRFVTAVNLVADGESPRSPLAFMAPDAKFRVTTRRGHTYIDPTSYQRYDEVAKVIASFDAAAAGKAYSALRPLLNAAYREIGRPGSTLDGRLAAAIQRLVAVPVLSEPVEVVAPALAYKFADDKLESLPAADKHLLRMGPRNTKLIQQKLREIAAALNPPQAGTPDAGGGAPRPE